MCIEHPDHTGASSNPLAPWNQPDAEPPHLQCPLCHYEPDVELEGAEEGSTCRYSHDADDPCDGRYEVVEP